MSPKAKARTRSAADPTQKTFATRELIHDAKRPETRARRIERFVQMLRDGRTIY